MDSTENLTIQRVLSDKIIREGNHFLKAAHACSLNNHQLYVHEKVSAHSNRVTRQASYPAMVPDLSVEGIEESFMRRNASKILLESNPNVFKRKNVGESTSDYFLQKHKVRHFLNTMHPYRDPQDKQRVFTQSRIPLPRDDDDLKTKPEDFLNPRSLTAPRKIGYNPGHIRSVLQLDTYGPEHSAEVELKRSMGLLPPSPNMDRNRELRSDICAAGNARTISKLRKDKIRQSISESGLAPTVTESLSEGMQLGQPATGDGDSANTSILTEIHSEPKIPSGLEKMRCGSAVAGNASIRRSASANTTYRPGTVPGQTCTLPGPNDHLMTDSNARRLEWHRNYVKGKEVCFYGILYLLAV